MTTSLTIRRGTFFAALLAMSVGAFLFSIPSVADARPGEITDPPAKLPGVMLESDTNRGEAYLAGSEILTTSPSACYQTFSSYAYPCLRIRKPKKIWVVGWFSDEVGWAFGDGDGLPGWRIECRKGRRGGERVQIGRDGLLENEWWVGTGMIELPFPRGIAKPDWCEVSVEIDSPLYASIEDGYWWDYTQIAESEVQIRATSRRR